MILYFDRNAAENMNKKFGKSKTSKTKRPRDLKDDGSSRMTPPPDKPTVDVS